MEIKSAINIIEMMGNDDMLHMKMHTIEYIYQKCLSSLTLSDSGYLRQLTIRGGGGGGFKSPPPNLETIVSIFTISHMYILPGDLGMFQLEILKKIAILTILQRFQIKSSENRCKNIIFVILFKITFKYTKRWRILMRT